MDQRLTASHRRLVSACKAVGISSDDATPIRVAKNGVWRLPSVGMVAKVYASGDTEGPDNGLRSAAWLADSGIPAIRPAINEAVPHGAGLTVFWQDIGEHTAASPAQMGELLRELHTLPVPHWMVRVSHPFPNSGRHLDGATWFDAKDRAALHELARRIHQGWVYCVDRSKLVPTHGDAWPGNFAALPDGRVLMLDLETFRASPAIQDLGTMGAKTYSIGQYTPDQYQEFTTAYGRDARYDSDYPIYQRIEEIRACAYALLTAQDNELARPYAQYRADCLLGRIERPWVWTPLPVDYRKNHGSEQA